MTKQNARTAIFTLCERTLETEERLYKECSRALHCDGKFKYIIPNVCMSDESLIPALSLSNNDPVL